MFKILAKKLPFRKISNNLNNLNIYNLHQKKKYHSSLDLIFSNNYNEFKSYKKYAAGVLLLSYHPIYGEIIPLFYNHKRFNGCWEFPAGKCETYHHSSADTAIKELFEETCGTILCDIHYLSKQNFIISLDFKYILFYLYIPLYILNKNIFFENRSKINKSYFHENNKNLYPYLEMSDFRFVKYDTLQKNLSNNKFIHETLCNNKIEIPRLEKSFLYFAKYSFTNRSDYKFIKENDNTISLINSHKNFSIINDLNLKTYLIK